MFAGQPCPREPQNVRVDRLESSFEPLGQCPSPGDKSGTDSASGFCGPPLSLRAESTAATDQTFAAT